MKKADAHIDTIEFLDRRFDASRNRQRENGVQFNLTRSDYWLLVCRHRTALSRINRRYIKWLNGARKTAFRTGYVLTWVSREAYEKKIMNKDTTAFVNIESSKKNCFLKKGDHHTEGSKLKISVAKTGIPQSESHRAARAESMRQYWARRRAEQEV